MSKIFRVAPKRSIKKAKRHQQVGKKARKEAEKKRLKESGRRVRKSLRKEQDWCGREACSSQAAMLDKEKSLFGRSLSLYSSRSCSSFVCSTISLQIE